MAQVTDVSMITLLGLLVAAVVSDICHHRIPNFLVVLGICLGLTAQLYSGEWQDLRDSLYGAAVAFLMLMPIYCLRGMSAGDVKLMTMVGSFLGVLSSIWAVLLTLLVGGVLALLLLLYGRFVNCLPVNYLLGYLGLSNTFGNHPAITGKRFPYALAVFTGTLLSILWRPAGLPAVILG